MGLTKEDYKQLSDEDLMRSVIERDQQAFEEIYDRYASPMLNYFYRMLWKDREKAEDFVQDLFSKIVQKPESFNPERKFKTWFYSIANNMCKNEYKKQQVRSGMKNGLDESYNTASSNRSPEQVTDDGVLKLAIDKAVAALEQIHREVFELRYQEHLSIKEIAKVVKTSEGTVKSRLFYATKKLAAELEGFKIQLKN